MQQLSLARNTMLFANANRGEKTPPFEDVGVFLPHPDQWKKQTSVRQVDITRETAIEFLKTMQSFNTDVESVFSEWLDDINAIAQGI